MLHWRIILCLFYLLVCYKSCFHITFLICACWWYGGFACRCFISSYGHAVVVSVSSIGALDHSISSSRSMSPRRPVHAFGWLQSSHAISLPVSHRTRTSCGPGAQAFTPTTYRSGYELGQPLCTHKTSLPCHCQPQKGSKGRPLPRTKRIGDCWTTTASPTKFWRAGSKGFWLWTKNNPMEEHVSYSLHCSIAPRSRGSGHRMLPQPFSWDHINLQGQRYTHWHGRLAGHPL